MTDEINRTAASQYQPAPQPGNMNVTEQVVKDLQERSAVGTQKYGTPLQTHNGRKPLWDAYQEILDLVCYVRQELLERESGDLIEELRNELAIATELWQTALGEAEAWKAKFMATLPKPLPESDDTNTCAQCMLVYANTEAECPRCHSKVALALFRLDDESVPRTLGLHSNSGKSHISDDFDISLKLVEDTDHEI